MTYICKTNKDGKRHCVDGPAVVWSETEEEWYINGKRHRIDGPARITDFGSQWYVNGLLHREDGPAVIYTDGLVQEEWYRHGRRHRIDGPAYTYGNRIAWYIDGNPIYTDKEFQHRAKLSDEDMSILVLKYGNVTESFFE
jgi:hypothetical protein